MGRQHESVGSREQKHAAAEHGRLHSSVSCVHVSEWELCVSARVAEGSPTESILHFINRYIHPEVAAQRDRRRTPQMGRGRKPLAAGQVLTQSRAEDLFLEQSRSTGLDHRSAATGVATPQKRREEQACSQADSRSPPLLPLAAPLDRSIDQIARGKEGLLCFLAVELI